MQLKYSAKAKETGAYVVGAAGWVSMPVDMGVHFLKTRFPGCLAYAETFCNLDQPKVSFLLDWGKSLAFDCSTKIFWTIADNLYLILRLRIQKIWLVKKLNTFCLLWPPSLRCFGKFNVNWEFVSLEIIIHSDSRLKSLKTGAAYALTKKPGRLRARFKQLNPQP